jgi:hypothetical protein
VQADGTMGVEVVLKHFLTRWPWLCELSLLTAVTAIFCPPSAVDAVDDAPTVQPWMYVNIVLESVQAVLPVSKDLLKLNETLALAHGQAERRTGGGSALPAAGDGRSGGAYGKSKSKRRSLMQLTSIARFVKSDTSDTLSQAVVDRPAVFQLMCQARAPSRHFSLRARASSAAGSRIWRQVPIR